MSLWDPPDSGSDLLTRPASEPLALRASGHESWSTVRQQRVGKKGIHFSAAIARFGDILMIEVVLVEIGPRSLFDKSTVRVRQ